MVLLDGRIQAEGLPAAVLTEEVLAKLYGVPVRLFPVGGGAYAGYRACLPVPAAGVSGGWSEEAAR
jgi:ABC-type cobalamin/Fe3+-siderophores transport system ATPase subunit